MSRDLKEACDGACWVGILQAVPSEWDLPLQSKHALPFCPCSPASSSFDHGNISKSRCLVMILTRVGLFYNSCWMTSHPSNSARFHLPFSSYSTRLGGSNCSLLAAHLYTIIPAWSSLCSKCLCPTPNSNTPWRWYLGPLEMLRSWREKPTCMRLVSLFKKEWVEWNPCLSLWRQNEKLAIYGGSGHHQNWICWWLDLGCLASRTVRKKSLLFV